MPALLRILAALTLFCCIQSVQADEDPSAIAPDADTVLLTIFLKHTQELTLSEMGANLRKNGFFEKFPPEGIEVVSWVQMMSFGHIVTLKVPPARIREVNRAIESSSYTTFKSEVYVGYDFWPVIQAVKARRAQEAAE
jgi:hypothetical protein